MSTIEGGMVSTDDPRFHDLLLMLRSHGWSKDLNPESHHKLVERYRIDDFHSPFVFYEPGFNLRSTDLNAFIGLRQLDKLERMTRRRQAHHARYLGILGNRFMTQRPPAGSESASISFGLLAENPAQRRAIVQALAAKGIETRIFSAGNLGLHPFWINRYGAASFPVADRIHHCGFFLPNHASLDEADIDQIAGVVLEAA
jgi:CDP-4-dehydro-6-deoxyglucose reductase, E1